jgi:Ca-activated chloride channel family protein
VAVLLAVLTIAAGCGSKSPSAPDEFGAADCTDDCVVLNIAVSSEKIDLLTQLAKDFNATTPKVGNKRIVAQPKTKASGLGADLLVNGWDEEAEGPKPDIWSPASSAWGAVVDQRLTQQGKKPIAGQGTPFMNSPLVIAMPKPMADALGYPGKAVGWSDILTLANDPNGWSTYGHPEWGPFRLGKTNPNFSTSGLHALIAQNYAATNKTSDLSMEDLVRPDVLDFDRDVEAAVVHYGDTTLTFLNNWYRADARGNPYTYASAVAVEEKSVIDYNDGNPDGVLAAGEVKRKPRVPLVAIYPKEGTLFSDSPFFVLGTDWVTQEKKDAAKQFGDFVQKEENQQKVLQYNFRPGNPKVAIAAPIVTQNGVNPDEPQTTMQVPSPAVMIGLLDQWNQNRKGARVLLVIDVSGSMSAEVADGQTKLDLAKSAASESLNQFKNDDLVGLREFSTNVGPSDHDTYIDLIDVGEVGKQREQMLSAINGLFPTNGTPLYDVTLASMKSMLDSYDPARINAVVLLTDGKNEDSNGSDDAKQLNDLLKFMQDQTQGENAKPVRLFTIGYGSDADTKILTNMAEAANGSYYAAKDPKTINKVFIQVISNF